MSVTDHFTAGVETGTLIKLGYPVLTVAYDGAYSPNVSV
jgi:hypothetical protein